ncbi:MAG: murein transglycosylase B [Sulfurovum sp.]|nr:MAG: murein transglycosylase B [Sulfurovum sp.]
MTKPKLSLLLSSMLLISACSTKKDIDVPDINTSNSLMASIQTNTSFENSSSAIIPSEHSSIETTSSENSSVEITSSENSLSQNIPTEVVEGGLSGDFAGNYKLMDFIDYMQSAYQFKYEELYKLFSEAKDINQMIEPYKVRNTLQQEKGKWDRYKKMFVYERNIQRGINFWAEYEDTLNKAYQTYGVPPEYIVGIIGVETAYGVNFGKKRVIDVLTSKAMLGDRREDFYTQQLEKFLIMTRQSGLNASELMGSNAGAMGYGQFIASSYLDFAVDFNNDGVTDLWNAQDAIGSIANYFSRNGWNRNTSQVAVRARYRGNRFKRLETGYKTKYSQYKLRKKYKITPRSKLYYKGPVSLIKLHRATYDELWFGTHNFRVITTYNHSTFYGMAVYTLGETVKQRRGY